MSNYSHDVIVIGAGAAGLTAAGGCAMFGLRVALIEAGEMGGECLNNGCVPSKALLAAAKRAAVARVENRMGVRMPAPLVEWFGVRAHVDGAIAAIAPHDSVERFEEMGCEVIRGQAKVTGRKQVQVNGRTLTAPRIVIATGSAPFVPPIEGIDKVPFLTNENIFALDIRPSHLIVLGGGAVGMEMAQAFRRLGSDVTLIAPGDLLERDDRESAEILVAQLKAEGVRFAQGMGEVVEGRAGNITMRLDNGKFVTGSHLLVATGRKARVSGFGLEELGVALGDNGILVDKRRRSSVKTIYAIGDCREGPRLTHVAGYEGSNVVLEVALGVPAKADFRALPWCTYTSPQIGQVGLTEQQAREKFGEKLTVIRQGFDHNDRAVAEGEAEGFAKFMFKRRKLVGASLCGEGVDDVLLPLAQAITGKGGTFALGGAVVPYPTRGEIAKAGAFAAWEPVVFGKYPKKWAALVQNLRNRF